MKCDHDIIVREILINLSQKDFLNIGMDQIAYIRPLKLHADEFYAVHAADGTPISVVNSMDSALASVKSSEMHAVTVH